METGDLEKTHKTPGNAVDLFPSPSEPGVPADTFSVLQMVDSLIDTAVNRMPVISIWNLGKKGCGCACASRGVKDLAFYSRR